MNAPLLAKSVYGTHAEAVKTPRDTEYEALARVTARLSRAAEAGPNAFPDLAKALNQNGRLWAAFAEDLAHPANGLPADLRARLLFLARFSLEHSRQVLLGKASIDPLVETNTIVMRGLRGGADSK